MLSDKKKIEEVLEKCDDVFLQEGYSDEEKIQSNEKARKILEEFFEALSETEPEKNSDDVKEYYTFYMDGIYHVLENVRRKRYTLACRSLVNFCSSCPYLQYRIYSALLEIDKIMKGENKNA